jgi:hypothetical protein
MKTANFLLGVVVLTAQHTATTLRIGGAALACKQRASNLGNFFKRIIIV